MCRRRREDEEDAPQNKNDMKKSVSQSVHDSAVNPFADNPPTLLCVQLDSPTIRRIVQSPVLERQKSSSSSNGGRVAAQETIGGRRAAGGREEI